MPYIPRNLDDPESVGYYESDLPPTLLHNPPLTPLTTTPEVSTPELAKTYSSGGHEHAWIEYDEDHIDGHMTAICSLCGSGITYLPSVHGVENGNLTNR